MSLAGVTQAWHDTEVPALSLTLTSPAFRNGGPIPARHACEGEDRSPALVWHGVPPGTRSPVPIVDDPDAPDPKAPRLTWVHWVLYNLPPRASGLPEGVAAPQLRAGTLQGGNDWHRTGHGGPCPPIGEHRHFHKLHAPDAPLPDRGQPTKAAVERAMKGHVPAQAELRGVSQKQQRA